MAITNKGQFNSCYNRKIVTSNNNVAYVVKNQHNDIKIADTISKECSKKLTSRLAVKAIKVYKANNYDLVTTSMKNYRLQRKYNTCDFNLCYELEFANNIVKNYKSYTIEQLQNLITSNNESIILKAIERHINNEKSKLRLNKAEKELKQKQLEKKANERAKKVYMLKGIYKSTISNTNYGKICLG